jgi:hypothetical protein
MVRLWQKQKTTKSNSEEEQKTVIKCYRKKQLVGQHFERTLEKTEMETKYFIQS